MGRDPASHRDNPTCSPPQKAAAGRQNSRRSANSTLVQSPRTDHNKYSPAGRNSHGHTRPDKALADSPDRENPAAAKGQCSRASSSSRRRKAAFQTTEKGRTDHSNPARNIRTRTPENTSRTNNLAWRSTAAAGNTRACRIDRPVRNSRRNTVTAAEQR